MVVAQQARLAVVAPVVVGARLPARADVVVAGGTACAGVGGTGGRRRRGLRAVDVWCESGLLQRELWHLHGAGRGLNIRSACPADAGIVTDARACVAVPERDERYAAVMLTCPPTPTHAWGPSWGRRARSARASPTPSAAGRRPRLERRRRG